MPTRDLAAEFRRRMAGELAEGWDADLKVYETGSEVATRNASQDAIQALAGRVPELFGGAADLSESNLTDVKGEPNFSADEAGRNLRFGVREHAMGGIANGIAYHGGFIPYDATFLTFSDYMRGVRPAVRAGRPARHLRLDARLGRARRGRADPPAGRALRGAAGDPEPVVRPAGRCQRDVGRLGAWRWSARDGPVALALTRQKLPTLPGTAERLATASPAAGTSCARPRGDGDPRLILIAHRVGAAARVRGGRGPRGRRHPDARRVAPLLGALRRAGPTTTATPSCRRASASA